MWKLSKQRCALTAPSFSEYLAIPPYMSIAWFVKTLKSKNTMMIFDRHANLKYKYGSKNF